MNLLPPFYRSVMVVWFRRSWRLQDGEIVVEGIGISFCPLHSLTVSFVYRQLLHPSHAEHRCVSKYHARGIHLWHFVRPIHVTNWSIAYAVLPTTDCLLRFKCDVNARCHCGQVETFIHLFTQCLVAKCLVAWYQCLVFRAVPQPLRSLPLQVFVGYPKDVKIPDAFPCLLGIIRHRVWVASNGWRFDQTPVDFRSKLSYVKSTFRFLLCIQQHHCPAEVFMESWLAGGVVGHVTPDNIVVFSDALV